MGHFPELIMSVCPTNLVGFEEWIIVDHVWPCTNDKISRKIIYGVGFNRNQFDHYWSSTNRINPPIKSQLKCYRVNFKINHIHPYTHPKSCIKPENSKDMFLSFLPKSWVPMWHIISLVVGENWSQQAWWRTSFLNYNWL